MLRVKVTTGIEPASKEDAKSCAIALRSGFTQQSIPRRGVQWQGAARVEQELQPRRVAAGPIVPSEPGTCEMNR